MSQFRDANVNLSDQSGLLKRARRKRRLRNLLMLLLATVLFGFWFIPPVYKLKSGPVTVTRWIRTKGKIEAEVGPSKKGWIRTEAVSHHVLHAIIVAEDARFDQHPGLDAAEIWNSLKRNIREGRYARGGSTITQQVVKVAFLSREKTLLRKAREALGALLLETILAKDEILEWYINLVEFGDGVYGIREGAWHYFKTKPELLTIEQGVHLALVLPSPNKWSQGLRRGNLTNFGHRRFAYILNRMRRAHYITEAQWTHALTRGNFGRPIQGYQDLLAEDDPKDPKDACGDDECADMNEDFWDENSDGLVFPKEGNPGEFESQESATSQVVDRSILQPAHLPNQSKIDESTRHESMEDLSMSLDSSEIEGLNTPTGSHKMDHSSTMTLEDTTMINKIRSEQTTEDPPGLEPFDPERRGKGNL